jgi:hypothetical protein
MKMLKGMASYDSDAVNRTDDEYAFFRGEDNTDSGTGTSVNADWTSIFLEKVILDPAIGDSFVNFDDINGNDQYPQVGTDGYAIRVRNAGLYSIHAQFAVNDTTRNIDFFDNATLGTGVIKMVRFEFRVRSTGSSSANSTIREYHYGQNLYRISNNNLWQTGQGHSTVHMLSYINNNTYVTAQLRWFSSTTAVSKQTGVVKEPSATGVGVTPLNTNYFSLELIRG